MAEVQADEVVTGEAVVLHVPVARFPSRMAALAIDAAIQLVLLFVVAVIIGMIGSGKALDAASAAAVILTSLVLIVVGYPIIWETASRGRSPGKFALGLRVVSDDGSPERFRQALVRGLAGVVEIWLPPFFGSPALISSLLSSKGKRLGDLFAGTYVIQQRLPARRPEAYLAVPPHLVPWAVSLQLSGLSEQAAESARQYLARMAELRPAARAQLGAQLATMVSAQVSPPPPPGTPAPVYLAAVLAERRRREQARWIPPGAGAPPRPTASYPAPSGQAAGPLVPPQAPPTPWTAFGAAPSGATTPAEGAGTAWRAPAGEGEASEAPAAEGLTPGADDPPAARAGGFVPPA